MSDFEVECPRCKRMGEALQQAAAPQQARRAAQQAPQQSSGRQVLEVTLDDEPGGPAEAPEPSPAGKMATYAITIAIILWMGWLLVDYTIDVCREGAQSAPPPADTSAVAPLPPPQSPPATAPPPERPAPAVAPEQPSGPELTLGEWEFVTRGSISHLRGYVRNSGSRTLDSVVIGFNLYNSAGVQVGSTSDAVSNLAPGGVWEFEAPVFEESATRAKVTRLSGW